jgi:hypothetical protein
MNRHDRHNYFPLGYLCTLLVELLLEVEVIDKNLIILDVDSKARVNLGEGGAHHPPSRDALCGSTL